MNLRAAACCGINLKAKECLPDSTGLSGCHTISAIQELITSDHHVSSVFPCEDLGFGSLWQLVSASATALCQGLSWHDYTNTPTSSTTSPPATIIILFCVEFCLVL